MRRDIYAVARFSRWGGRRCRRATVYGSSGAENQYIIDGLNTTGVELGDKGKTLNIDFIQEVGVKTGGLPAEYGRMTGGVVNVGHEERQQRVRGIVLRVHARVASSQANENTRDERPARRPPRSSDTSQPKPTSAVTLGGFIVRDRLWFFGSVQPRTGIDTTVIRTIESPGSPAINSVIPSTVNRTRCLRPS